MKKIAILGAGSIGQRHMKNLMQLGCGVRAYDPANDVRKSYRNELIDWADAVVIASPTSNHLEDINDCRRAEKPCFVEKPIGHMPAEMITSHVKMVGYNLRFHSCVKKTKHWIDAGLLGAPIWANFTCAQFNDRYPNDDVIFNWSHEIDLALYLLGPATVLSCATKGGTRATMADILLRHRTIGQTNVHLDYLTQPEIRGFTIEGSDGQIIVDLVRRQAINRSNVPNACDVVFNGQDSFDENYLDEMRAFLMRLDGQPTIGCTAKEGLDVLDVCLKAKEMAR